MSTERKFIAVALAEARRCLARGGSLMEAAMLVGWGRDELDLALWRTIGRNL